jgi:hypothetical protein
MNSNSNCLEPLQSVQPQVGGPGTRNLELALFAACLAFVALAAWGPSVAQHGNYHAFADQRSVFGIPNAMDLLSNLAFAGFGVLGAWRVWRMPQGAIGPVQWLLAGLFFAGLLMTAACSAWYHYQTDDSSLAIDRYGMTIAFASLLGLAAATRVSDRAGQCITLAVLIGGAWSIQTWSTSNNVLPWAVLQFGGMALMLGLGFLRPRPNALVVSWFSVILVYALAKVLEHYDTQVYHLSADLVSGHTLKHLVASCAALPILRAVERVGRALESSASGAAILTKP